MLNSSAKVFTLLRRLGRRNSQVKNPPRASGFHSFSTVATSVKRKGFKSPVPAFSKTMSWSTNSTACSKIGRFICLSFSHTNMTSPNCLFAFEWGPGTGTVALCNQAWAALSSVEYTSWKVVVSPLKVQEAPRKTS